MLSNKGTFSLTSLVIILVLAFVAPSVMAAEFGVSLSISDAHDVSYEDGYQIQRRIDGQTSLLRTTILVKTDKVVNHLPNDAADDILSTGLHYKHFTAIAYNRFGGTTVIENTQSAGTESGAQGTIPVIGSPPDGKNFQFDFALPPDSAADIVRIHIFLEKHKFEVADPRVDLNDDGTRKVEGKNAAASIDFYYVRANGRHTREPTVYSIERSSTVPRPVTEATFDVVVTLSEEPKKDTFTKDRFDVSNADITNVEPLGAFDDTGPDSNMASTGRGQVSDWKIYKYLLTVTPKYENKNDIVIKIKEWESQEKPGPEKYTPPSTDADRTESVDKLTVKVGKEAPPAKTAGFEVVLDKEKRIPASGYLVVATKIAESGVADNPENDKDEPKASARTPAQLLYNVIEKGLPNLETFLANGGTIDLIAPAGVYISEVMWGSDASLQPSNNSQWIEIANTGTSSVLTGDKTHKLKFYGPNETLPALSTVADRIGTVGVGGHWELINKGQPGRTGTGEKAADVVAVVPTQALISMQRVMNAAGSPADGTLKGSWVQSEPPGLNFSKSAVGTRIGTPGAAPVSYPVPPKEEKEETPPPETPVAEAEDIMITEIMVDTGNSRLPQWIELTNVSGAKVSLAGWSVQITNSGADADAVGSSVNIDLMGTLGVGGGMDKGGTLGKSLLLVAWSGRSSSNLDGSERVVNVSSEVGQRGRYKLISDTAFMIALIPPQKTGVLTYGDTAGNLGATEAWELPMSENGRSSLIRREMLKDGTATMGTDANGWILASETPLVTGHATWYGSDEDAGTPGSDAGGPLPVELSHFRPARDKATGAVVITWSTQSELNNAGFFIKRSQQRDGEFKVINAAMVPGAGTTSEKQSYTYTDTTAQPNVVYYYQIEDVSLDGNRQTLTNGIRLKGHVGAADKLTTTWGDLKTHE